MNIQELMKQAQQMQERMQKQLAETQVEATAATMTACASVVGEDALYVGEGDIVTDVARIGDPDYAYAG